ncbi:tRNA pseudouridine38/39 synthase [Nematocida displodere]|uniref:tRNA pseudouridine synthase n=1 Tax=Nematocida displodere TaxID=1805483 RepID=A0A177EIG0_9MICR|nr:tRNA pseudouridine38/39 synthase [Nematocida displodere]
MRTSSNVLLKLSYVGRGYYGFAYQPGLSTIEYFLFRALTQAKMIQTEKQVTISDNEFIIPKEILNSATAAKYHKCGRTDAGVSAAAQYISLVLSPPTQTLSTPYPYDLILNQYLPPDIRVLGWMYVDDGVSARFSCEWREYEYYFAGEALDLERMRSAAKLLEGTHWLGRLSKPEKPASKARRLERKQLLSPDSEAAQDLVRTVDSILFEKQRSLAELGIDIFVMRIRARSFLHNQVRKTFGLLRLIGSGTSISIKNVLDMQSRGEKDIPLADSQPLVLARCAFRGVDLSAMRTTPSKRRSPRLLLAQTLVTGEVSARIGAEGCKDTPSPTRNK